MTIAGLLNRVLGRVVAAFASRGSDADSWVRRLIHKACCFIEYSINETDVSEVQLPKLGMPHIRRRQLIDATFSTIQARGLDEATVASVAQAAGLSAGIVAHYFGNKTGLVEATMRQLLRDLGEAVAAQREAVGSDEPRAQLQAIVDGNFDATQTNPAAMRVWLSFWAASMTHPELRRLQRVNHRRLHSNLLFHFRRCLPPRRAVSAASGLAALIDGLWLRGGLAGRDFDVVEARRLAFDYIDQILSGGTVSCRPALHA